MPCDGSFRIYTTLFVPMNSANKLQSPEYPWCLECLGALPLLESPLQESTPAALKFRVSGLGFRV